MARAYRIAGPDDHSLIDPASVGLGVTVFVTIRTNQHNEAWLGRFAAAGVADLLGCERSFPHCAPRWASRHTEEDWELAEHVASALLPPAAAGAETERGTLDVVGHIVLQDYLERKRAEVATYNEQHEVDALRTPSFASAARRAACPSGKHVLPSTLLSTLPFTTTSPAQRSAIGKSLA